MIHVAKAIPICSVVRALAASLWLIGISAAHAQISGNSGTPSYNANASHQDATSEGPPSTLTTLIEEAQRNNQQIIAAQHAWRAGMQVPSQVSTFPDPQVTVQQFAVGSPRPFAGFSNSDFAYIGFGVSQDIPFPGKLGLKRESAQTDANAQRSRVESVRRGVIAQLTVAYFQLAYEYEELSLLDRDGKLLAQIAQIAEANYRVGKGNEQDVLKAQLERTKLLTTIEMHHQEHFSLQAKLRQLLNRPATTADIVPDTLTETAVTVPLDELLSKIRTQSPDVRGEQEIIRNKSVQLEMAHKDFYPDFTVQYMWQHTASQYRDYYMLSVGARIPIHRSRKQWPEVEQAVEELHRSEHDYQAQIQQAYFDTRDQYLKAQTSERILKIYREGLIPLAANTLKAGLATYEVAKEDFDTLLNSYLDVLRLDEEYWRSVLDHQVALAEIEQITGVPLSGLGK